MYLICVHKHGPVPSILPSVFLGCTCFLLQVIPLEELGRPRIDVVVNCSGVFRDLFVNQMILLDRAVKMAAEQDEPLEVNFVRKHALEQVTSHHFPLFLLCLPKISVLSLPWDATTDQNIVSGKILEASVIAFSGVGRQWYSNFLAYTIVSL